MPLKYLSFNSWNNSPLHVYFNCTTPVNQICKLENSTEFVVNAHHSLNELPGVLNNNGSIHLELFAFAKRDLHILFSEKKEECPGSADIQIVIGSNHGNDNYIRVRKFLLIHSFPFVLNTTAVNTIDVWINDGEVKVKVNNDYELKYKSDPIAVKYVSFASWNGSPLYVYFNCTKQHPFLSLAELINESFHPCNENTQLDVPVDELNDNYVRS